MKKRTKIIIIAVVAVALVALAVWYFGFHKKKAKETEDVGKTDNVGLSTVIKGGSAIVDVSKNGSVIDVVQRTDYGKAPAAAYRLNSDQTEYLNSKIIRKPSDSVMINTNKEKR